MTTTGMTSVTIGFIPGVLMYSVFTITEGYPVALKAGCAPVAGDLQTGNSLGTRCIQVTT